MRFKIRYFSKSYKSSGLKSKTDLLRIKALLEGEQKERSRLGRELHDGIGAMLMTLNMQLSAFKLNFTFEGQEALEKILGIVNETSKELKNTIHNLMPESIALQGLEQSIHNYIHLINKSYPIEVHLFMSGNWQQIDGELALHLFRIVQELLQNIVKHAGATIAAINLILTHKSIILIVEDDGKGIEQIKEHTGNGLKNIRWRVAVQMGIMSIESAMGKGTIIHITIPRKSKPSDKKAEPLKEHFFTEG